MKLWNKRTGEIIDVKDALTDSDDYPSHYVINDGWEDVPEEPKKYWCIDWGCTGVRENKYSGDCMDEFNKAIGNYFSSKQEAEKAVEKLKAFKRLKDKGFEFDGWKRDERYYGDFTITATDQISCDDKDLDICFGGEE